MTPADRHARLAQLAAERAQAEAFRQAAQTNHERRAAWETLRWCDRQQRRLMQEDTMLTELSLLRAAREEYEQEAARVKAALAVCDDEDDIAWLVKVLAGWNAERARVSAAIARLEAEDVLNVAG